MISTETDNKFTEDYFFKKFGKRIPVVGANRTWPAVFIVLALFMCYKVLFGAPFGFPDKTVVRIPSGSSLVTASKILEEAKIIRSPLLFRMVVRVIEGQHGVKAGDYLFDSKQNLIGVGKRLVSGERGFASFEIVVPEGTSAFEISQILEQKIVGFDGKAFYKIAKVREGYLFPDTYQFSFDSSPEDVLKVFLENFDKKVGPFKAEIELTKRSLVDVIKMASIVEEEGRKTETRKMIAGILWRRIDIGMPLQVDASFLYINGKNTYELTTDDLQKDSPYNTYTRVGLPPTAISNPGLDSILATINPTKSPYLFYLTDHDGVMRYAKTHDEHVLNKERYLR